MQWLRVITWLSEGYYGNGLPVFTELLEAVHDAQKGGAARDELGREALSAMLEENMAAEPEVMAQI